MRIIKDLHTQYSQLNPKFWGGTKLEVKINNFIYFSTDLRLQGYITEMLGILSKIHGYVPQQNNKYIIGERKNTT
jgi:hypothetical protein